jgi:hypothetical protein
MVSAQLSLFDTAAAIKPAYKVGDLVRVKRKTPQAPLVKKGDIIQIEAIHPHDGSCKFWNDRTESWGYLYPNEFVLLPPGEVDSITSVESVVTESKVPPGKDDSVTPVESVVTESKVPPGKDDSVTPVESVVTESKVPPGKDDSVTPVESVVTESKVPPGEVDSVTTSAISTYRPRGTARGIENVPLEYFRFSYRQGSKVRHVHIRGGNTNSPIAQAKVAEVRSLLAAGMSPAQIAVKLRSSS